MRAVPEALIDDVKTHGQRVGEALESCRAEAHRASLERALADVTRRLDELSRQR